MNQIVFGSTTEMQHGSRKDFYFLLYSILHYLIVFLTIGMVLLLPKQFSLKIQLFYLILYNFYNMDLPLILALAGFFCLLNSLTLSHPSIQPCILSHLTLQRSPQILKIMFHQELLSVKYLNIFYLGEVHIKIDTGHNKAIFIVENLQVRKTT